MANRYWVGGGSDWDGVAGTKWATTSGGAGGASVPTSIDDVFLDAGSAGGSCSITTGNTGAKSLTCTGYTGFLLIVDPIDIYGSLTLSSGMTFNSQSLITFKSTGTITSAGKVMPAINIDGVGIIVSLGDAFATRPISFSLTFPFNVIEGTFNTNNYNFITNVFWSSNSNTRTLNFGSSQVTIRASGPTSFDVTNTAGLTIIGNGTVSFDGGPATLASGGVNTAFTINQNGAELYITGSNTFANITSSVSTLYPTAVYFVGGTTNTFTAFGLTGSVGNVCTLSATGTGQATLRKPTPWNVGANSTNAGNNTGLSFTAGGGIDYLAISDINGEISATGAGNFFVFI